MTDRAALAKAAAWQSLTGLASALDAFINSKVGTLIILVMLSCALFGADRTAGWLERIGFRTLAAVAGFTIGLSGADTLDKTP